MKNTKAFDREDFMSFFRNDDKLSELSTDDRIEIFKTILVGSTDITKDLLDGLLRDYGVGNLEVVEV
jgi:hypothetical protein